MRKTFFLSKRVHQTNKSFSLLRHLEENIQTGSGTTLAVAEATPLGALTNSLHKSSHLYRNKSSSSEGDSFLFENNKYEIIECNNKAAWADHRTGYCHLCREPIGGSIGIHVGDRDHTSMQVCTLLSSIYPRTWKPKDLFEEIKSEVEGRSTFKRANSQSSSSTIACPLPRSAKDLSEKEFRRKYFSTIYAFATNSNNCDHLHVYEDAKRRAELEALLTHLIDGGTMSRSDSVLNKWSEVPNELIDALFREEREQRDGKVPSHSPSLPFTSFSESPVNLDEEGSLLVTRRHPNAVLTHSIVEANGSFPFWYSGERMWKRHMIKMITIMFPPMQAGVLTNFSQKCWGRVNGERMFDALNIQKIRKALALPLVPENKERKAFFVRAILWELVSAKMRPDVTPVTEALIDITIRRFCFELIFLQTMVYMNKVQEVVEAIEFAEYSDLKRLNLW